METGQKRREKSAVAAKYSRREGGIEFTAFLLLFGIFEEGELFEIVFGKTGHGDADQAEGLAFPGFAEELFGAAVDFICHICRIGEFGLV